MALIAAINPKDGLVLLEDGRELPITGYYSNRGAPRLKATDEIRSEHRVSGWEEAEVFTVEVPGADAALIVEIQSVSFATQSEMN